MYNSESVVNCLMDARLIGIRPVFGQYALLDKSLTDNATVYLNDVHPLVNYENIYNSFQGGKRMGYTEADITKKYPKGYRVLHFDCVYESLIDENSPDDIEDTTKWEKINVYSDHLIKSIRSSIDKCLQQIFVKKKVNSIVKTIIDDFRLFDGRAELSNKNANNGRFVGFKISPHQKSDVIVKLPKVSFQFDQACPDLKLYVYHTSQEVPVTILPLNYDQPGIVKWFDCNLSVGAFLEGDYIIGYFEGDLSVGAQSIRKETNLVHQEYCGSCNSSDYNAYVSRLKFMKLQPFYVDQENLDGINLWNEDNEVYVEKNNWGMNIQFSAQCDLSDFLCRNKMLLADAISKQAAVDILMAMQFSTNDNQVVQKLKSQVNYALYGDKVNYNRGLIADAEAAMDALSFDLSGLNKDCLPCNESRIIGRKVV